MNSTELLEEYFLENRTKVLEIAAFLDRVDRAEGAVELDDYRWRAFRETLRILADSSGDRMERIQMLLSDPTVEPKPELDHKGASGAFDHWTGEAQS
jgi:hypothetical protein